jgi:hypothetical protein
MDALNGSTGTSSAAFEQVPVSTWEPRAKTPKKAKGKKTRKGRSQFLEGERRAVVTAVTGATLYRDGKASTLKSAAYQVGTTNVSYVKAALVLVQAEAFDLIERVIDGDEPLLAAAAKCRKLAKALAAYREVDRYYDLHCEFLQKTGLYADLGQHLVASSPIARLEAARAVGADAVWDGMIAPLMQ